jgi:hypothetical protein
MHSFFFGLSLFVFLRILMDMGENSTSYKTALVPAWKSLLFGESSKKIDFYCYSLIHPEIAEKNLSRKTLFIETSVKL